MTSATSLIHQHLLLSLGAQQHSAEPLAETLTQLAAALFHSFLNDGKTVIHAPRTTQWLAHYWAQLLTQGFERERMGLPALVMDASSDTAPEKPIYTHGRPQDVLIVLTPHESGYLKPVLTAAAEQGMFIAWIGTAMPTSPVHLPIVLPHTTATAFHEHLPALCHSVCAALDAALLDGLSL